MPLDSKAFSREALDLLLSYHWPGNIRELESTVSRAALSAPGRIIRGTDIEFLHTNAAPPQPSSDRMPSLAQAERSHIVRVLEAVQWNKKEAARVLEISRGTLYRKIDEYQLEPEPKGLARRTREADKGGDAGSRQFLVLGSSCLVRSWSLVRPRPGPWSLVRTRAGRW